MADYDNLPPEADIPRASRQAPSNGRRHVTKRRSVWRRNCLGGCLAIGGAFIAFGCVAGIVAAILLPSIYRGLRPEQQAIWCSRAQKLQADFVCDWKPTPPFEFLPSQGTPEIDPFLILTPSTATPDLTGGGAPVATESSLSITPPAVSLQTVATQTATPSPTFSPTVFQPSPTPMPPTPTLPPTPLPIPVSYRLDTSRLQFQYQTWNNCGPATLSMGLSYFGYWDNQSVAARYLKPNGEDKNVSPYQMVNYVNQQVSMNYPVNALYRMGGDMQLLKTLIANNFPVLVEKGYDVDDLGWMGHYLFLMGYDDAEGVFFTYDSYRGHGNTQGLKEAYTHLAEFWRHFNYTFIVLYEPERQQQLLGLLGDLENPQKAAEKALNIAQQQVTVNPNDNWAWFNMGSSYTYLGDYARAAQAFDQAFILGMPWRTLWYLHTPYIAYYAMGRYADILAYAQATENTTVYVEETFFYRGVALAAEGDVQGALQQFATALEYNRNFDLARIARDALQNGTFTEGLVLTVGVSG